MKLRKDFIILCNNNRKIFKTLKTYSHEKDNPIFFDAV